MGDTLIQLRNLSRRYQVGSQTVDALDAVDLDIERGEFVAIMGRSGSGKSTLLNILGLMDRPNAGHYILDGQDVARLEDDQLSAIRNRQIGFVFQSFHLLPRFTALENVMVPRQYHPEGRTPESQQRARHLLDQVGLADRMDHRPNELSGGQRQRVAIARALINEPSVLLADEPTGNLDSTTAEDILALLKALNRSSQTILMVTHEADIAAVAARRIEMLDGRVVH